jgi:DNA mismatch endonuclease (patch repair protein)
MRGDHPEMDVLTKDPRRLNMSRIRGKDTKPEMLLRRRLHAAGLRFRLHAARLPGKPDMVFPRFRAIILIHGCFWHGHDCPLFRLPATRLEFWTKKISGNRKRDLRNAKALHLAGWRLLTVWECSLKGSGRRPVSQAIDYCINFIKGEAHEAELAGSSLGRDRRSDAQHERIGHDAE